MVAIAMDSSHFSMGIDSLVDERLASMANISALTSSPDITAATDLLRSCEEVLLKALARIRSRQNSLAPIARLPPEILAAILHFLVDKRRQLARGYYDVGHWNATRLVCKRWNDVIVDSPELWSYSVGYYIRQVDLQLKYSRDVSLDAYLEVCDDGDVQGVHAVRQILAEEHRIHELRALVTVSDKCHALFITFFQSYAPRLENLNLDSMSLSLANVAADWAPRLTNLTLVGCAPPLQPLFYSRLVNLSVSFETSRLAEAEGHPHKSMEACHLLDVLGGLQNIQKLDLQYVLDAQPGPGTDRILVLPTSLQSMHVIGYIHSLLWIMQHVSLPVHAYIRLEADAIHPPIHELDQLLYSGNTKHPILPYVYRDVAGGIISEPYEPATVSIALNHDYHHSLDVFKHVHSWRFQAWDDDAQNCDALNDLSLWSAGWDYQNPKPRLAVEFTNCFRSSNRWPSARSAASLDATFVSPIQKFCISCISTRKVQAVSLDESGISEVGNLIRIGRGSGLWINTLASLPSVRIARLSALATVDFLCGSPHVLTVADILPELKSLSLRAYFENAGQTLYDVFSARRASGKPKLSYLALARGWTTRGGPDTLEDLIPAVEST
ncbi:hypothetical protein PENSPDRAFT_759660 [Peniophora sp. CONT]|nr:hypothetical protein PENSPDRAFT_759660 [Peniophora sp. CONT]